MTDTPEPMMRMRRSAQFDEPELQGESWMSDPLALSRGLGLLGAVHVIGSLALASPGARAGSAMLGFTIWGLVPWMALLLMGRFVPSSWIVGGAGVLALTVEASVRAAVFLFPQRSTAAVALVVLPAWVAAALVAGALCGFVFGQLWGTGRGAIRAAGVLGAVVGLGFVGLGLARPDLLPTAVLRRRALLERIGPPRVVSGENAFELKVVSNEAASFMAANLDGQPGDEIAVVTPAGADVLDGLTFEKRGRLTLSGGPRLWNWLSRLVLLDGNTVIAQTGGGFQPTEVRGLDGALVWAYRPGGPSLPPPSSLRPADLDLDGTAEFYASTTTALSRLDAKGVEIWTTPASVDQIVATAPRDGEAPGIVLAASSGRAVLFSDSGAALGEVKAPAETAALAIFDTPGGRGVAFGGASFAVLSADGRTLFERPGEDGMRIIEALSVRPARGAEPFYAIVLQGPRDVARSRMLIVDAKGAELQNVVLTKAPGIFKSRAADGSETLFVVGSRLSAVRPRVR